MLEHRVLPASGEERHDLRTSTRIAVRQDLDLAAVGDLSLLVVVAVERGARTVVLDLSSCAFVDLTGCRLLRGLREHVTSTGANFSVEGVSPRVDRLLELLNAVIECDPVAPPRTPVAVACGPASADGL